MPRQIYLNWPELCSLENMIHSLRRAPFNKGYGTLLTLHGTITWLPKGIVLSFPDLPSGVSDDIAELLDARITAAENGG